MGCKTTNDRPREEDLSLTLDIISAKLKLPTCRRVLHTSMGCVKLTAISAVQQARPAEAPMPGVPLEEDAAGEGANIVVAAAGKGRARPGPRSCLRC